MNDEQKLKLLALYPEYKKVHGPYLRKDGRKHCILYASSQNRRTISYPKALVEIREGRRLREDETVDHNDRDFNNNASDNLIIRTRSEHGRLDATYRKEIFENCIWCGELFKLSRGQVCSNNQTRAGPFCSKSCSGKYGASVQNGGPKLGRTEVKVEYHRLEK